MAKNKTKKTRSNVGKKLPPKKSEKNTTQKSISKVGNKAKGNIIKRTTITKTRVHSQSPTISKRKNKTQKTRSNVSKKLSTKKSEKKITQKSISKVGNKAKGNSKKRTTRPKTRVHSQSSTISKKKNTSVSVSKRKIITVSKPKSVKQSFKAEKRTLPRFRPGDVRKIRGQNILTFKLPERNFSKKADRVKSYKGKEVKKMVEKNRPKKGAGFKPPQAVLATFKIWNNEKKQFYYITKISKPDFVVNEKSTKEFIADSIKEYYNEMDDFLQEHYDEPVKPYNLSQVSIKFIY